MDTYQLVMEFKLQKDTTIAHILETWPQTASLFLQYQMGCIGCRLASFCTLEEVAESYGMDILELIKSLCQMIQA